MQQICGNYIQNFIILGPFLPISLGFSYCIINVCFLSKISQNIQRLSPLFSSVLFSWSIVRHQTNKGKEVMATTWIFFHLLVDSFSNMRWENLHQGGCCQSSHGVVLDCSSWKVSISHKGKVIDSPKIWLTCKNFAKLWRTLLNFEELC